MRNVGIKGLSRLNYNATCCGCFLIVVVLLIWPLQQMGQFTRHTAMLPIDALMLAAMLVAIIAAFATVLCQRQRLLALVMISIGRVGGHADFCAFLRAGFSTDSAVC